MLKMKSIEKNGLIFLKLLKDENVNEMINETCKKHKIKTAVILSGIGQLKNIMLGYFKERGNYTPQTFKEPLELLMLSGNICREKDKYITHFHGVFGSENKKAMGGHFINGTVSITAEIVLLKTDIDIGRKIDIETGLKNLHFQ